MNNITCPNPDCRVAETGKCVEGFQNVSECPHQKLTSKISETQADAADNAETIPEKGRNYVSIASGDLLTIDEANDVLCESVSRVITVIGPHDSGKTTFILSLYNAFQHSTFGDWSFGGSFTLPAFEQRSHLASAAC